MLKYPYLALCALVFMFTAGLSHDFAELRKPAERSVARLKTEGYLRGYSGLEQCVWKNTFASHQVVVVVTECPENRFVEFGFYMQGDEVIDVFMETVNQRITEGSLIHRLKVPLQNAREVIQERDQWLRPSK